MREAGVCVTPVFDRRGVLRWVRATLISFTAIGFGYGSWLSRLPAVRDELGASTQEMSYLVLTLAIGTLGGLVVSGPLVTRIGPRRAFAIGIVAQIIAFPAAIALLLFAPVMLGIAALFFYGLAFALSEVAVNVNGAGAERAFGRARMPLFHAGFSLGTVAALGVGALAERFGVPLQWHFIAVFAVIGVTAIAMVRFMPHHPQDTADAVRLAEAEAAVSPEDLSIDELESVLDAEESETSEFEEHSTLTGSIPVIDSAAGQQPAFTTMTGTIPIISAEQAQAYAEAAQAEREAAERELLAAQEAQEAPDVVSEPSTVSGRESGDAVGGSPKPDAEDRSSESDAASQPEEHQAAKQQPEKQGSAWRDPRIVLVALIALSMTVVDGAAADWLPLALVDERGVSNELGATMLSVFFASIVVARLAGSALIDRFGRVAIIRVSAVVCITGVVSVILVPNWVGIVLGTVAWGLGAALAWPIAISAAADRPATAARDVAAVSALGYAAMMSGPILIGFLGEHLGLMNAFWSLPIFAVLSFFIAGAAREPWRPKTK